MSWTDQRLGIVRQEVGDADGVEVRLAVDDVSCVLDLLAWLQNPLIDLTLPSQDPDSKERRKAKVKTSLKHQERKKFHLLGRVRSNKPKTGYRGLLSFGVTMIYSLTLENLIILAAIHFSIKVIMQLPK